MTSLFLAGVGPEPRRDPPADRPAPKLPAAAENPPAAGAVRELHGQERNDAIEARDNADLARAAYEKNRRAGPAKAENAADDEAAFAPVQAAYQNAITRYPGTEIDCHCRIRLAGAYQFRGQFDRAVDQAKQAAERFAGTEPGMGATQAVGLIYLQALHDPAQAAVWFNRLNAQAADLKDESSRGKWQVAAAQGLARCEAEKAQKR